MPTYSFSQDQPVTICKGCHFCATEFTDRWELANGVEELKGCCKVYCRLTKQDLTKHNLFTQKPDSCQLQETKPEPADLPQAFAAIVAALTWIPVAEQLPRLCDFLRYNEIQNDYALLILRNDNEPDMIWTRSPDCYDKDYFVDCGITHWISIPALPKKL